MSYNAGGITQCDGPGPFDVTKTGCPIPRATFLKASNGTTWVILSPITCPELDVGNITSELNTTKEVDILLKSES